MLLRQISVYRCRDDPPSTALQGGNSPRACTRDTVLLTDTRSSPNCGLDGIDGGQAIIIPRCVVCGNLSFGGVVKLIILGIPNYSSNT